MANELQSSGLASGTTYYAVVRSQVGQYWNAATPAFENFNGSNWVHYAISAAAANAAGDWTGNFPSAITQGLYGVQLRQRVGTVATDTDTTVAGPLNFNWNGASEVFQSGDTFGVVSQTQGTTWFVSTAGSDSNIGRSWATAFALVSHAASVASAGDTILVGPGTINQGATTITLPAGVTLKGAGINATTITCSATDTPDGLWIVTCGSNCVIEDLTINSTAATVSSFAFAIGDGNSTATNVWIRRVAAFADTDIIYVDGISSSFFFEDCVFNSKWDCIFNGDLGSTVTGFNSQLITAGPSVALPTESSTVNGGNTTLVRCSITHSTSASVSSDGAIRAADGAANISLVDCSLSVTSNGGTVKDIYITSGSTVTVANTQYNTANVSNTDGTLIELPAGGNIDMMQLNPGSPVPGSVGAGFKGATTAGTSTLTQTQITGYAGPILTDNSTGAVKLAASQNFNNAGQTTPVPATGYSGGGIYTLTTNITGTSGPIAGATVTISGAQAANPPVTDGSGDTIVVLNAGTVEVNVWAVGFASTQSTQTVSSGTWASTSSATLQLSLVSAGGSLSPGVGQTTAYLTVRDGQGEPVTSGVTFNFQLQDPLSVIDAFSTLQFQATSDGTGLLQVLLRQGTKYQIQVANVTSAPWTNFETGTASTFALEEVLGNYPG